MYNKTFEVRRIIRGNPQKSRRPHVEFEGVTYKNECLRERIELIGQTVILTVNPNDVRRLDARLETGEDIGPLTPVGGRFLKQKTLAERQQYLQMVWQQRRYRDTEQLHAHQEVFSRMATLRNRQKEAEPIALSTKCKKGPLRRLLDRLPAVEVLVLDMLIANPQVASKEIHKVMLDALHLKGVANSKYPFCANDLGYKALDAYLKDKRC